MGRQVRFQFDGTDVAAKRTLPLPKRLQRSSPAPRFAHPAELELARLLTFYGVRWVYEPTSFVLTTDDNGRPTESFTPDFYLSDERLYLELTTMRQALVTRKNRKLRLLRELYPSIRVKLLYRRDFERLIGWYPQPRSLTQSGAVGRVLYDANAIAARVDAVAERIANSCFDRLGADDAPVLLLEFGRGCGRFCADLQIALAQRCVPFDTDAVSLSRFRPGGGPARVRVRRQPTTSLSGRHVLVVTDAVNTGLSLAYVIRWLYRRGVASVETCTLLDRSEAHLVDPPIQHVVFAAPLDPLVGYGLRTSGEWASYSDIALFLPGPAAGIATREIGGPGE